MNVKIKRIDKSLPLPEYHTEGSVGFDLYSSIDKTIAPGELAYLPSNIIVETPKNYMLMLTARSSLFKKKNLMLSNSVGIFDTDFCGNDDEIIIQVINMGTTPTEIVRGERIVQGIFVRVDKGEWEEVNEMSNPSRGRHGSTDGK